MQSEEFGVTHIDLHKTLQQEFGRIMQDRTVRPMDAKSPSPAQIVATWPKVKRALHRGTGFIIEIDRSDFHAELYFDPQHPAEGTYSFQEKPNGSVERGSTKVVKPISVGNKHPAYSMLKHFPTRFFVLTVTADRSQTEKLWRIGLNKYIEGSEAELD